MSVVERCVAEHGFCPRLPWCLEVCALGEESVPFASNCPDEELARSYIRVMAEGPEQPLRRSLPHIEAKP